MEIRSKFVRDLKVGDVVVALGAMQFPPVLHYVNDDLRIHHSEVVEVRAGWEEAPVFDPIEQDMTPHDTFERSVSGNPYTKSELMRIRMEAANAQPNVGKKFPAYTILLGGFENSIKLDQMPAEHVLRALDIVQIIDGDLSEIRDRIATK